MAYRLKKGKISQKAFRRLGQEQIVRALDLLNDNVLPPESVHECRKVVKRVRALLRLVEPHLSQKDFKNRYRSIGKVGDTLASAREQHVLGNTVTKLIQRYGRLAADALAPLCADRAAVGIPGLTSAVDVVALRGALAKEVRKFSQLTIAGKGFEILTDGLEATYRKARAEFKNAYAKNATDEHFHELRKVVQWHWRQLSLIAHAWPEVMMPHITACRELAEILGDDHDLSVLVAEIRSGEVVSEAVRAAAIDFAARRQKELRAAALPLCKRLFAEAPKAHVRRLGIYWRNPVTMAGKPEIVHAQPDAAAPPPANGRASTVPRLTVKSPGRTPSQAAE